MGTWPEADSPVNLSGQWDSTILKREDRMKRASWIYMAFSAWTVSPCCLNRMVLGESHQEQQPAWWQLREALSTRDKRPNFPSSWPKVFCPVLEAAKVGGVMGEASVLLRDMDWLHDKAWDPLAGSNHNCFLETKELCLLKTTHFHERSRSFH